MNRRPLSRPLFWLALVAWLAQLCLPAAHAAVMARADAGMAAWCGPSAPAMQAKLAQLAPDVRQILQNSALQSDAHGDCVQLCASAAGGNGLPPVAPTILLRAAGLETVVAIAWVAPQRAHGAPPPARGPPALS